MYNPYQEGFGLVDQSQLENTLDIGFTGAPDPMALIAARRLAPTVAPGVLLAASQTTAPIEMAQATQAMTTAIARRRELEGMDAPQQMSAWIAAPKAAKDMLVQVGYTPPHRVSGGALERAVDVGETAIGAAEGLAGGAAAGAAIGAVFGGAGAIPGAIIGGILGAIRGGQKVAETDKVLDGFGWALDDIQHAYRTMKLIDRESVERGSAENAYTPWKWSWNEWARRWKESGDDTADFSQPISLTLQQQGIELPDELQPVFADMVKGMHPFDLQAKWGPLAEEVNKLPNLADARSSVEATQLSFGRQIAYHSGVDPTSKAFSRISGTLDAAASFLSDPVNMLAPGGSKILQVSRALRYVVTNADDVRRLAATKPVVARAMQRIGQEFGQDGGGIGRLTDIFPHLRDPHISQALARSKPKTAEEAVEFFADNIGLMATYEGRAARYYSANAILPSLAKDKVARQAIKQGVLRVGDTLEQVGTKQGPLAKAATFPARALGRSVRRQTPLPGGEGLPSDKINLTNPDARNVVRLARLSHRTKQADQVAQAFLEADVGGRREMLLGIIDDVGTQMGLRGTKEGEWLLDDAIGEARNRSYGFGPDGMDGSEMSLPGRKFTTAVLPSQMSEEMSLPDWRKLAKAARSARLFRNIPGANAIDFDSAMSLFKQSLLVGRVSYVTRNAGEEALRQMLDTGALGFVKQRARSSRAAAAAKEAAMTSNLAQRGLLGVNPNPTDIAEAARKRLMDAEHLGEELGRTERKVLSRMAKDRNRWLGRKLDASLDPDEAEALQMRYEHHGPAGLPDSVSSSGRVGGDTDDVRNLHPTVRRTESGRQQVIRMRKTKSYKAEPLRDRVDNEYGLQAWRDNLEELTNNEVGKIALANIDDPDAARDAVAEWLRNSDYAKAWNPRANWTSDGRQLGISATEDDVFGDWATKIVDHARYLTHTPSGAKSPVLAHLLKGELPDKDILQAIPLGERAGAALAQELVPVVGPNAFYAMTSKFFSWAGRSMDWISRTPIYGLEWDEAYKQTKPWAHQMRDDGVKDWRALWAKKIEDVASARTIKHVDSADFQTQFSVYNRNLIPFWRNQQQFLMRWGETMARNPGAVRKAQLTVNGLEHSGFLHRDDQGDLAFYYPGSGWMHQVIEKSARLLGGTPLETMVPIHMTGKVKRMVSGIDTPRSTLLPSVGPIGILPLAFAKRFNPDFAEWEKVASGSDMERSLVNQFMPTTVMRFVRAFTGTEDSDAQIASAGQQAVLYLEASGHGLPDNATPVQKQEFQDRVTQQARVIMGIRAAFSLILPTSPGIEYKNDVLSDEYRELLQKYGMEEAHAKFVEKHPNGTPYEVFRTTADAPMSPGQNAAAFLDANSQFVKDHGSAAAWFLPQAGGKFDPDAWDKEIAMGLRKRKSWDELWQDVHARRAAVKWYPAYEKYQKMRAEALPYERDGIDAMWQAERESFMQMNPLWEMELAGGGQRAVARRQKLEALEAALQDPNKPKTENEAIIAPVIGLWRQYVSARETLQGRRDVLATQYRRALERDMVAFGNSLTDPLALSLYQRLIRPDLPRET